LLCNSLSLSLSPVAPTLEHRASVKRFVSLHFINHKTVGNIPWTGDQLVARPLPTRRTTQTQNKRRNPCHEWDSNPRSQRSSGRRLFSLRPRGHCDRHCDVIIVTILLED
jgi:hypothetical protein